MFILLILYLSIRKFLIVLVTGHTGFIGQNLCLHLKKKGVGYVGFSRSAGYDIFDIDELYQSVKTADIVIHLAADAKPGESVLSPVKTIETNIRGSLNVLEACRKHQVPLIYPSSCEIYGDSKIPLTEEHPINPTNPYAASKAAVDRFCFMYSSCYGMDIKIVRFFNPYGVHQQLNKIIPTFYFNAIKGAPIPVFGDGTDTRDYVNIEDVVRGLWMAKDLPKGESINLATGVPTTNLEMAQKIVEYTGSESKIILKPYPKKFGGITNQVGSYSKALNLINWKPNINLDRGLASTIKWLETVNPT